MVRRLMLSRNFLALLGLFLATQLFTVYVIWDKPLLWDSSVYVGMGKWLYSLGSYGYWEMFRPPVLPLLLGLSWLVKLPMTGFPRLLSVAISSAGLAAVYAMTRRLGGERQALLAAGILGSSHAYYFFTPNPLTGILASTLVFGSMYGVSSRRYAAAGLAGGLAFLTRFPAALLGPAAVAYIIFQAYSEGEPTAALEPVAKFSAGFFSLALPYLALNNHFFGSFTAPFASSYSITAGAGTVYMSGFYYFWQAVVSQPMVLLLPLGVYAVIKSGEWHYGSFLSALIVFYGFFTYFPLKIERYVLLFLPLMALFAARGIEDLLERFEPGFDLDTAIVLVLAAFMVFSFADTYTAYAWEDPDQQEFFSNIQGLEGDLGSNDPRVMLYGDFRYHPVPPGELDAVMAKNASIDHFAVNGCYWDCRNSGASCEADIGEFESWLEEEYSLLEKINGSKCKYSIYSGR